MPAIQYQLAFAQPLVRVRSVRRLFHPSKGEGPYRLPHTIQERLISALAPFRNRDAALSLAIFLGRFWTAPNRLGLAFPIDRRALAGHRDLKLSEAQIRGASRLLEEVGFLEREEAAPGAKFQRTAEGLHRRPILFRFSSDFLELF